MSPEYEQFYEQQLALQDELANLMKANTIIRHQVVKARWGAPQLVQALGSIGQRLELAESELDKVLAAMSLESKLENKSLAIKKVKI